MRALKELSKSFKDTEHLGEEKKYYVSTEKVIKALLPYEINIPKRFVDKDTNGFHNGALDYISSLTGINIDDMSGDNTYNINGKILNDLNYTIAEDRDNDKTYVACSIHLAGDLRWNYTDCFVLEFDYYADFYEVLDEVSTECTFQKEINGKTYLINPQVMSEYLQVWCKEDDEIYDIFAVGDEDLEEQIKEKENEND